MASSINQDEVLLRVAQNLVKELLEMPYYRNYAAASGAVHNISKHEDAVKDILLKNNLKEWLPSKKLNKETIKSWINTPSLASLMPSPSFIVQPCGTHNNPDFLLKLKDGVVLAVECKSADKEAPQYNSGGLKQNYIYVFSSEKKNATTLYLGRDIVTVQQQKLLDELIEKQREIQEEYNKKIQEFDLHHRGINYYTRPMIIQSGGSEYTDYFSHPERNKCEENVLLFIVNMICPNPQ